MTTFRRSGSPADARAATGSETLVLRSHAFERLGALVAVLDGRGVIVDTNAAWRLQGQLHGAPAATTGPGVDYLGVCDRAAAAGVEGAARLARGLRQVLAGERETVSMEYPCPSPTEDRRALVQASAASVSDGAGVVVLHLHIPDRSEPEAPLPSRVERDELTGLADRSAAVRALEARLTEADVTGPPVEVLVVGLDGFRAVNEARGHRTGDELLRRAAARFAATVDAGDLLARLAGDRFVVIRGGSGPDEAATLAERLRAAVREPFVLPGGEVAVGASVGIASSSPRSTVVSLLDAADTQMSVDKRHRRRRREATLRRRFGRPSATAVRSPSPPEAHPTSDPPAVASLRAMTDAIVARSRDLAMFFEPDGTIAWASAASQALFGVEPDELVGFDGFELVHPDDRDRVASEVAGLDALGDHVRIEFRVIDLDGRVRWIEEILTNLLDEPNVGFVVGNLRDVTDRKEAERQVELDRSRLADARVSARLGSFEIDTHTGAVTRSAELWRIIGHAPGSSLSIDLDHIHPDDRDRVAAALAEALAGCSVLIRPAVADLDAARQLGADAERLLRQPLVAGGRDFELSASIGVALSDAGSSPESLLRDADAAMCQAKEDGRARITVFDVTSRARARRRHEIETALRHAVGRGELRLEYQPVLALADLGVAGFEALLRWEHPTLGAVAPDELIPIAESSGLILRLGDWVLTEAVRQLAEWQAADRVPDRLWVAVNLSVSQLGRPGLVDRLSGLLSDAGVTPDRLHIEITESVLMDRVDGAMVAVGALRDLGVGVAIDDFGTGCSSLSYLNRLPADTLKIDRSFVHALRPGGPDMVIVRAITALADTLGFDVVAEGIERPDQLELLIALGCTHGQGFLWSRALPAVEAVAWMAAHDAAPEA